MFIEILLVIITGCVIYLAKPWANYPDHQLKFMRVIGCTIHMLFYLWLAPLVAPIYICSMWGVYLSTIVWQKSMLYYKTFQVFIDPTSATVTEQIA
jgi:hypothetical protein